MAIRFLGPGSFLGFSIITVKPGFREDLPNLTKFGGNFRRLIILETVRTGPFLGMGFLNWDEGSQMCPLELGGVFPLHRIVPRQTVFSSNPSSTGGTLGGVPFGDFSNFGAFKKFPEGNCWQKIGGRSRDG